MKAALSGELTGTARHNAGFAADLWQTLYSKSGSHH
jgi:hypothetical protein